MKQFLTILTAITICCFWGCAEDSAAIANESSGGSGQGGSLARFTIVGDYLYTLEPDQLRWYRIHSGGNLEPAGQEELEGNKETIFPLGDLLFLGASEGMSIYQIDATGTPVFQSEVFHIMACDPVVANEDYAFVTLRTESCVGFGRLETANLLNIYNVNDVEDPNIVASYDMISPRGLGLAGDYLFVCEGPSGLRTLRVDDPQAVEFIAFDQSIHANDVIVLPEALLVIGPDNITQFDYSDPMNLVQISEISLN
ncbi:MAG: hypothetical protein AAGJ82_11550 [Bacteroidota bacterium]